MPPKTRRQTSSSRLPSAFVRRRSVRGDEVTIRQAQQIARSLERAAVYLHGHTIDQMTGNATQVVQSKPWQAVMIAFVVGIIFGRSFRRDRT